MIDNNEAYKNNEDLMDLEHRIDMMNATGIDPWGTTLNGYQQFTNTTKTFPEKHAIVYPILGLCEEAGEVAGKLKRWLRGDTPNLDVEGLKREMGDVLWYLASLATDLGITLEDVAKTNIEKLTLRKKTNTLKGSGDNREEDEDKNFFEKLFKMKREPFVGDIVDPQKEKANEEKNKFSQEFKKWLDLQPGIPGKNTVYIPKDLPAGAYVETSGLTDNDIVL